MHNASESIAAVVQSFLDVDGLDVEVVVVDDASSDASVQIVEAIGNPRVQVLSLAANRGAGVARNVGFEHAGGRYTLFFDADDIVHADALHTTIRALDAGGADVGFTSYRYRRGSDTTTEGMNSYDEAVWSRAATPDPTLVRLGDAPQLLGFSNYPWNKVIRTDRYRETGLRFGETPVHNDILGHWLTLLDARSIVLVDQPLCTHVVGVAGANLTNRRSRDRLALFDALDEVYSALERRPAERNRYSHHYWSFALRVAGWAADRISPDVRDEFNVRLQDHLLRMDLADFTRIRSRRDPMLGDLIIRRALA